MASLSSKAYWGDQRHQTFVQLCLEEVKKGLGRDPVIVAVTCGNNKWATFIQELRYHQILHLVELREIFNGTHATGAHSRIPSEGAHPSFNINDGDSRAISEGPSNVQRVIEVEGEDSSDSNATTGQKEKSSDKRSKSQQSGPRKRKESNTEKLDKQLLHMC